MIYPSRVLFILVVIPALLFSFNGETKERNPAPSELKGDYLGFAPPGSIPEKFAPGTITTNKGEMNLVFSPQGDRFVFLSYDKTKAKRINLTCMFEKQGEQWIRNPITALNSDYLDWDYGFSRDGNTLYFTSLRPAVINGTPTKNANIWLIPRDGHAWGKPKLLEGPINRSDSNDQYPAFTEEGNLYFFSDREGGHGSHDIYRGVYKDSRLTEIQNLGPSINTQYKELDFYVDPGERYIIFCSDRPGGFRGIDMYVSFRSWEDERWSEPQNLGETINSIGGVCPTVSPDGKYLFFTGGWDQSGGDIYWVDFSVIEDLNPDRTGNRGNSRSPQR